MIKIYTSNKVLWIEDALDFTSDSTLILGLSLNSEQELNVQVEKLTSLFKRYNVPVEVIPYQLLENV
jgi:hypothetical protein